TIVHVQDQASLASELSLWINQQFTQAISEQIELNESVKLALRYFYAYMSKNQRASLAQFNTVFFYEPDDFLILDSATQRNLELIKNAHDGTSKNTLFELMDCAKTAMCSRMIKKWIQRPLVKKEAIIQRQDVIALLYSDISLVNGIEQLLIRIGDIERVVGRIALDRAAIADYLALSRALLIIPECKNLLQKSVHVILVRII